MTVIYAKLILSILTGGFMGLVLGIRGILFVLITASLWSGLAAAIGLARKKLRKEDERPLGPWLCAAGIFYVFIVWPFMI